MQIVARVLALTYFALATFGGFVYVQAAVNYTHIAEVNVDLPGRVHVVGVQLNWTGDPSDRAVILILFSVTNPGRIAIIVMSADFMIHMDDPADSRPLFSPENLRDTAIQPGGFSGGRDRGVVVHPGETRTIHMVTTVEPGTHRMDRMDRPDADGLYHPIIAQPWILYTFVDFDPTNRLHVDPYYEAAGVRPTG